MRTLMAAILGILTGYLVGALCGYGLIEVFSTNTHDKPIEAVMTAAFVTGPAGAVIGLITAVVRSLRRKA